MGRIDLHMHTFLSDGELLPAELVTRAEELDHDVIGITDHVGPSNLDEVIEKTKRAADELNEEMGTQIIPGVELTHLPLSQIPDLASEAKERGAKIVIIHGETIVEPVRPGTNISGLKCEDVDILAHPGAISREEAELAAETGTYLEITSRDGHSLTNGRVVDKAREAGADMLINTDAHSPEDIITQEEARAIGIGAGISENRIDKILEQNPKSLIEEI